MDAPMTDTRFLSALRRNPSEDAIREAIATVASQFPRDAAVAAELATILAASGERLSAGGARTLWPTRRRTRHPRPRRASAGRGTPPVGGYCTDCTPQYQQQMIYARRCAHPGTTFDADGDGRRPGKEK